MRDVAPLRGRAVPRDRNGALAVHPSACRMAQMEESQQTGVEGTEPRRATPVLSAPLRPSATRIQPPLDSFAGVDRASAERLKRGRYPVEGRLDLHGMTQAEAHRALARFITRSRVLGRRCVLVITGHGRASGGILKTAAPRWLNEPDLRRHLLAASPAGPRDGGTGALYLLLRKLS